MWSIENLGVGSHLQPYLDMWETQRRIHAEVVARTRPDTLLLLEHEAVYTAGKRTELEERPVDGTPVIDVDRGGKITWHGPGQLVGYPIVRLPDPIDVVAHVRALEGLLIDVIAEFGVHGRRVEGRSGVWVGTPGFENKIAAIGIRVSEGVTMHGFALNCSNSLSAYDGIIACGIRDAGVTTLSRETGRDIPPSTVIPVLIARLAQDKGLAA
ncbi:MAG TPA: lipoyl(octanoyl) transferase LipB [Microbacteriaceae bacterium]|nr:lipoyl(octanoyl) transferase LipB [Microbacteriaceae bacterium]